MLLRDAFWHLNSIDLYVSFAQTKIKGLMRNADIQDQPTVITSYLEKISSFRSLLRIFYQAFGNKVNKFWAPVVRISK